MKSWRASRHGMERPSGGSLSSQQLPPPTPAASQDPLEGFSMSSLEPLHVIDIVAVIHWENFLQDTWYDSVCCTTSLLFFILNREDSQGRCCLEAAVYSGNYVCTLTENYEPIHGPRLLGKWNDAQQVASFSGLSLREEGFCSLEIRRRLFPPFRWRFELRVDSYWVHWLGKEVHKFIASPQRSLTLL